MDPAGKGVVVAGGAGNLGRAIVAAMSASGAKVGVIDADPHGAARIGDPAVTYVRADAAAESDVAEAVGQLVERLGSVSVLVNCTGLIHSEPLINLLGAGERRHRLSTWEAVVRSNLTATFLISAHVAEHMATARTKGVIVNFSSFAAGGNPGQSAYAASKAGIEALTRVWSRELGPHGIRVVAIAPGFVDTPSTRAAMTDEVLTDWRRRTPLRRLAKTDEIVSTVAFAIANDFLTGRTLQIDGGLGV